MLTDYTSGTTHHFVTCDGNGNVAALYDGTPGAATARYEYAHSILIMLNSSLNPTPSTASGKPVETVRTSRNWGVLPLALGAVSASMILCGCIFPKHHEIESPLGPLARNNRIYVFCGELKTNWSEGVLGVAQYEIRPVSAAAPAMFMLSLPFYMATKPERLPTSALLATVCRGNDGFELLGLDASRSMIVDNPENRELWKSKCLTGDLLPKRRSWLDKHEAIKLAEKALGIAETQRSAFILKCVRYELGWIVSATPRGNVQVIGSESDVVVGDDRQVKCVSHGF